MKKFFKVVALFVLAISLVGCSSEKTNTYQIENEGIKSTLIYTYKGDTVIRQETVNEMEYASVGINNKEDAKLLFDSYAADLASIEGIEHAIDYQDDLLVEKMSIDYETIDMEVAADVAGIISEGNTEKISMKQSEEKLLEMGYEKI
ncbi:DUF1307 domain-containing protein [Mollicutes bacterium LVI A0039]|nr:DUF1307 domain-containing protein [Mollicutes bacterium LVI A0039]